METNRVNDIDQCRTPEEKEFALAILARAEAGGWYGDLWFFEDPLILSVTLFEDREGWYPCVFCTLRADFYGKRVVVGKDPTHQLVSLLDSTSTDANFESDSPVELAQFAADWLEREMRRIDLDRRQ